MEIKNIVMIGCGNVASYFAQEFTHGNCRITQVYHPDLKKAENFAVNYQAQAISFFKDMQTTADLYFIAVSDSAIMEIANQIPRTDGLVVHTSGTVGLNVLQQHHHHAVFYPLQTFTKNVTLSQKDFPILIESYLREDDRILSLLAQKLGNTVLMADSNQRSHIHLAAVFVSNFTNHCVKIGFDLMNQKNYDPEILMPLIKETTNKLNYIKPALAQTGPAKRHDHVTMDKHRNLLKDQIDLLQIYNILSQHIETHNTKLT